MVIVPSVSTSFLAFAGGVVRNPSTRFMGVSAGPERRNCVGVVASIEDEIPLAAPGEPPVGARDVVVVSDEGRN